MYVAPILGLTGVHFCRFDVTFQNVEDAVRERSQFLSNRLDFSETNGAWNSGGDGSIESMDPFPGRRPLPRRWDWDALLEADGDDLDDVASGESDPFAGVLKRTLIGAHFFRYALELGGAGDERGEIKAEGVGERAASALTGVALSVGTVPADDDAGVDEESKVPAHGRGGHAMSAQGELLV
jgi:hypothetical protein